MPKAIRTDSRNNRTTGVALPGVYYGKPGSVKQQVHDGDTLNVMLNGNLGVRLLGIDTPEVSFTFPSGESSFNFVDMEDNRWNEFLTTAFDPKWGQFDSEMTEGLRSWFAPKLLGTPGTTHAEHADKATQRLRELIEADMKIMGQDVNSFGYYLGFGFEIMDVYGRLLCTINRDQPSRTDPTPRPPTYNLRLLERGLAFPYFIWPNVSPWDRPASIQDAVIPPGEARKMAESNRELKTARELVSEARRKHLGVFDAMNPCMLEPFELRMLTRRGIPSRYLIDLNSDSNRLIHPNNYHSVPNSEDRLWIPSIYVPLFEKYGWQADSASV